MNHHTTWNEAAHKPALNGRSSGQGEANPKPKKAHKFTQACLPHIALTTAASMLLWFLNALLHKPEARERASHISQNVNLDVWLAVQNTCIVHPPICGNQVETTSHGYAAVAVQQVLKPSLAIVASPKVKSPKAPLHAATKHCGLFCERPETHVISLWKRTRREN